jgi:hypothetical protein
MNGSFLGGAERRGNLDFPNTDKGRDCFTSFAMTVFYDFLREHQDLKIFWLQKQFDWYK